MKVCAMTLFVGMKKLADKRREICGLSFSRYCTVRSSVTFEVGFKLGCHINAFQLAIGVLCSAISLTIYLVKVSKYVECTSKKPSSVILFFHRKLESLEWCGTLPNSYQIIDLIVNIYMLLLFILRVRTRQRKYKPLQVLHQPKIFFVNSSSVLIANRKWSPLCFPSLIISPFPALCSVSF